MANIIDALTEPQPPQRNVVDALRPEETLPTPNKTPMQEQLEGAYGNEFTKGFRRGALGLAGTSLGLGGQVAEAFGAKKAAESMFGEARRILDFPQGLRPRVETWDNVNDVGSFVDYGLSKAGEAAPSTLGSLAAAGVGGAAGLGLRAAGLRAVTPSGASFAAGAGSMFAPEAGEAALTMQNDPQAMARTTPMERLAIAGGKGAVNAALEFLPERLALGRAFTRPMAGSGLGGLARSTAYGAGESALGEAGTEAAQEFTGQLAHGIANPQRDSSQDLVALREAALSGAFGGAPMGAVAGGIQGIRGNVQGALARGADVVEEAQARGKLPTTADVATFFRRSAQEPEYIGEKLGEAFLKGKDLAKEEWETISDLAAKAATKGEEIVGKANETLKDAIAASEKLDYPGNAENRQFLLSLQDNVGAVTKDLYYALKGIISNPTDARAQEVIGYHARGLATEQLPAAGRRSMDWLSRTVSSFQRSVSKDVRESVGPTDAKETMRKALALSAGDQFNAFRGLSLSDQRTLINVIFAAREAPKRITQQIRDEFESAMGMPIEAADTVGTSEVASRAEQANREYRAEMTKKIVNARKELAFSLGTLAQASPELRAQTTNRIAAKYGLSLDALEQGDDTGRTEADFGVSNFDEIGNENDAWEALSSYETGKQEGTPEEIQKELDPRIDAETLSESIQNMYYHREYKPGGATRPHFNVRLEDVTEGQKPLTGAEILDLLHVRDGPSYATAQKRAFNDAEKAQFSDESGAVVPIRPFSLSNAMNILAGKDEKLRDSLPPLRDGERGKSNERKAALVMSALTSMQNSGLKVVDKNGVERTLKVTPDADISDVVISQMAKQGSGEREMTIGDVVKGKPGAKEETDESLSEQRNTLLEIQQKRKELSPWEFSAWLQGKWDKDQKRFVGGEVNKAAAAFRADPTQDKLHRYQALHGFLKERNGSAAAAINARLVGKPEPSKDELKAIKNDEYEAAIDRVLELRLRRSVRKTVLNGLREVATELEASAYDRLDTDPDSTIGLLDDFLTYLQSDGKEVPDSVKRLFAETNVRLFTPKVLTDPAMKDQQGFTPQDRIAKQVERMRKRATENELSATNDRATVNDALDVDASTKEVAGVGNVLWDTDSMFWALHTVTPETKQKILDGFVEYKRAISKYGKWRIRGRTSLGFFPTKKQAQDFIASLPEGGTKALMFRVTKVREDSQGVNKESGVVGTYSLKQVLGSIKNFNPDKGDLQLMEIVNPDTGLPISLPGFIPGKMAPEQAITTMKQLQRALPNKDQLKAVDGTPMYTAVENAPSRQEVISRMGFVEGGESEVEFEKRFEQAYKNEIKNLKTTKKTLTMKMLEDLIVAQTPKEYKAEIKHLLKQEPSPQLTLDLLDDVLMEENVRSVEPLPKTESQDEVRAADKEPQQDDLFQPKGELATPEQKPERVGRTYIKAGLSGESTMNPMYLWKRSVVRARREQVTPTKATEQTRELPALASETVKDRPTGLSLWRKDTKHEGEPSGVVDDFGTLVRRDYRGKVVTPGQGTVEQGKTFEESLTEPPNDGDLVKALAAINPQTDALVIEQDGQTGYANRTRRNAQETDATVALAINFNTSGEQLTKKVAGKKYIGIDLAMDPFEAANKIVMHLKSLNAKSLNIAGNGIYTLAAKYKKHTPDQVQRRLDARVFDILRRVHEAHPLTHIRSGGQTGVDEAGIKAGLALGIPTKALLPKDNRFRNAEGQDNTATDEEAKARLTTPIDTKEEAPKPVQPAPAFTEREQAPEVNKAVAATENEYSGPAMQRRLERDAQLKKEADEFAAGDTYVVENVDAHGGKFRDLTPEQIAARAGQMAELRREPSNKYDPNAIKVLHNGVHHTYVSREYTKGMVENRAKGYIYAAKFDSTGKYLIIKRTAPKQGEKTDEFGYTPAMVAAEEAQNDPSRTAAKKADEQPTEPVTTRTIVGENIASPYRERKHTVSPLGAALTNVTFGKYQVERVPGLKAPNDPMHKKSAEAWYKANRTGNQRKDMLLMQRVIEAKLRQYPELVKQIDERGGEAWIKASNHTVNGNIRWEGKGMESNFLRVLRDAYLAVKEFPTVEQGNEIWRRYDSGYTRDEAEGFVRREPAEPAPTKAEAPTTDELTTLNTPHEQPKHHFVPMKYAAGPGQLRPELNKLYPKGATMLRLVNDGHRTGTTRTPQAGMRKGDTFQMAFSPKRYEVIGFERVDLDTPEGQERWSQREGWSVEGVRAAGHGNQVRTGSIQMIFAPVGEKPVIKEQRKTKKKEAPELVGPPEEQAGPPLPEFVGPPTARDLGIFKKEQEQAQEIPKAVPEKLVKLIEKMFGKKVAIRIGVPDGKNADDAAAWYVGRKALTQYKKNMEELQKVRADRRAALAQGDVKGANDLREREEELLKQTQVIGLIYLSPKTSEAEQLGSTYHEAVHAMFDILLTPEERAVLGAAFTQGLVRNKLRQIFKDDPAALEHMNEPEEAAAYAFQVWAVSPEQLPLGGKVSGLFNKLKQFLRKLFGILTPEERAEIIFNDMLTGRRAETGLSPLQRVLDKDMKFNERVVKTAREMSALVRQGWNLLATDMYDRLMMTENPAIQQIAQLGYTKTGEDRSLGMVQRLFQKNTEWLNRMDKAMKSFKPEAVTEAMEARLHKRAPKGEEAKRAFDAMTTYFDAMRSYFNDAIKEGAGNDKAEGIGFEKDYFPIAWDPEKVMKDREGFLKMLNKPEYAPFIEELKVTPNELWERISGYIIRGEKFTGIVNPGTGEPINDFVKERQLTFLDMNDMRPFLEDDAVHTMLRYTKQMVRHAEYIRAFGPSASKMIALKDEAVKKYGATPTQIEMVENYIDGLLGNREIGMPRELKDVYGAMVVYQNFRLLPFSLFSSLVDPLGIAVRSNRIGDAVETFGYAMRNLFTNLFNRNDTSKDVWERLAEDWGIIEDAQVLSNIHHMYESVELRGFSKRMNEALFKYNLLEGWVRSTKVMAVKAATRFIYRASQNQLGKDSERYLTELGLKPSDVVTDGKNGIAVTKAELMSQGVSEEQATQIEKRLQDAVTKFVNQAVLNPTAADLPGWGSNPYFAPIFHLKQFMFTFQNVIMARIGHEMERGNYKPLWLSTIFIPGMIAADALRGFVSNFGEEPPWQKDWGASDYLLNGVERSGLLGAGALFTGMKDDMMHGGTGYESLSGPTVEQARKGILAVGGKESMQNFVVKSMPLNPIYDQWLMSYGGKDAA